MRSVILSARPWNAGMGANLEARLGGEWIHLTRRSDFTAERLAGIEPDWIFIPHWSHLIPAEIHDRYRCVVFHMTDLPYGRGGSPLQNLIVRGHEHTRISAIRVTAGLDQGPVYLKRPLDLSGTAEEIFERASGVIEKMIEEIVRERPEPVEQTGEPELFTRRTPAQSDVRELSDERRLYDHIRMLDAPGYPHAFVELEHFKLELRNARFDPEGKLIADARFVSR